MKNEYSMINESILREAIGIEAIKTFISKFRFGRNGACDSIAEMIGKDLVKIGGIESAYYDCTEDTSEVKFLYERRVTSRDNIPHRIIELFEASQEMRYIGKIDLPYELYETCAMTDGSLYWERNPEFTSITKESLVVKLCKPTQFSPTLVLQLGLFM